MPRRSALVKPGRGSYIVDIAAGRCGGKGGMGMDRGNKILDDISRLMNEAAGVADGIRREVETVVKSQLERAVADLDLVKRDDYEALRELVRNQSDELAALRKELDALKSKKKSR